MQQLGFGGKFCVRKKPASSGGNEASTVNPFAKDSFTYPKHLKKPGELQRREAHADEITHLLAKAREKGDSELARFIVVGVLIGLRLREIAAVTGRQSPLTEGSGASKSNLTQRPMPQVIDLCRCVPACWITTGPNRQQMTWQ